MKNAPLKRTERIALWAALVAVLARGALAVYVPVLPWWVDLIAGLVVLGALYSAGVELAAHETIVDGELKSKERDD